jgi:hypothetical protein
MPAKCKRPCAKVGCINLVSDTRYCERHAKNNVRTVQHKSYDRYRANDPIRKLYNSHTWRTFRVWFLGLNPICMRIENGKRCLRFADTVHHLLSPRNRPDLFLDATNVKAVCTAHHHHGDGAQPDEEYVASETKLSLEEMNSEPTRI